MFDEQIQDFDNQLKQLIKGLARLVEKHSVRVDGPQLPCPFLFSLDLAEANRQAPIAFDAPPTPV